MRTDTGQRVFTSSKTFHWPDSADPPCSPVTSAGSSSTRATTVTGESSTVRVLVSGEATVISGVTVGVYLFRDTQLGAPARPRSGTSRPGPPMVRAWPVLGAGAGITRCEPGGGWTRRGQGTPRPRRRPGRRPPRSAAICQPGMPPWITWITECDAGRAGLVAPLPNGSGGPPRMPPGPRRSRPAGWRPLAVRTAANRRTRAATGGGGGDGKSVRTSLSPGARARPVFRPRTHRFAQVTRGFGSGRITPFRPGAGGGVGPPTDAAEERTVC